MKGIRRGITVKDARDTALRLVDKCRYAQRFHDQPAVKKHALKMMSIYLIDVDRIDFEGMLQGSALNPGLTRKR